MLWRKIKQDRRRVSARRLILSWMVMGGRHY